MQDQSTRLAFKSIILSRSLSARTPSPLKPVFCRPATQACACRPDSGGGSEVEGHLRLLCWLPCHRRGLRKQLWHLYPRSCKLSSCQMAGFCGMWSLRGLIPSVFVSNRSRAMWHHTQLFSCPAQMAWRCCCATRTRVSMSTPMDVSSRMWSCSGARCPHLLVGV